MYIKNIVIFGNYSGFSSSKWTHQDLENQPWIHTIKSMWEYSFGLQLVYFGLISIISPPSGILLDFKGNLDFRQVSGHFKKHPWIHIIILTNIKEYTLLGLQLVCFRFILKISPSLFWILMRNLFFIKKMDNFIRTWTSFDFIWDTCLIVVVFYKTYIVIIWNVF